MVLIFQSSLRQSSVLIQTQQVCSCNFPPGPRSAGQDTGAAAWSYNQKKYFPNWPQTEPESAVGAQMAYD